MAKTAARRIPAEVDLTKILPGGVEGGKEFARVIDLLLFYDAQRKGVRSLLFNDAAGDYRGLDSLQDDRMRTTGTTGYQYKFYPSPLSDNHRADIEDTLITASANKKKPKLKKWILITPQNLLESSRRRDGGDVSWFESLREKHRIPFEIEHWGHKQILALFLSTPVLCLYYYPNLVAEGQERRRTIQETRLAYDVNLVSLYRDIQFVGMSVYKPETSHGIAMENIYIPLRVRPELASRANSREDPLQLLSPGSKRVFLGDPGSGKSTLLRFLALVGTSSPLQNRYSAKPDDRLPILITLRRYADALKSNRDLPLIDYILNSVKADFSLPSADLEYFLFYLESGRAIFAFDGLDELPNSQLKQLVRDRIVTLTGTYPGNTILITSRIVGYDASFSLNREEYSHHVLAALEIPEIEAFVSDWYGVRIENLRERTRNVEDLVRIIRDEDHLAIRQLASNPLLLTIIALVHRVDAVLPDDRVVLYQKCTETLLNTWHAYKYAEFDQQTNKTKAEKRNKLRIEAIAHWMHCNAGSEKISSRAVVAKSVLLDFLTKHISQTEPQGPNDEDPADKAEEFLDFVRRRAGLLIEAGDEQFSFVHLTFQEFLTASFMATENEPKGIEGLWLAAKAHIGEPRWYEVFRLLVAILKSPESQQLFIDKLIRECDVSSLSPELLGGLLIDGNDAAESRKRKIVSELLTFASSTNSLENCVRLVHYLNGWAKKESFDPQLLKEIFLSKLETTPKRTALIGQAIKADMEELISLSEHMSSSAERFVYLSTLGLITENPRRELLNKLCELLAFLSALARATPELNDMVAQAQGLFQFFEPEIASEFWFLMMLSVAIGSDFSGPFSDFLPNTLRTSHLSYGGGTLAQGHSQERRFEKLSDLSRRLWEALRSHRTRGMSALSASRILPVSSQTTKKILANVKEGTSAKVRSSDTFDFIQLLLEVLNLKPYCQWRVMLSGRLTERFSAVPWIFDEMAISDALSRLTSNSLRVEDDYILGIALLVEAWSHLHKKPESLNRFNLSTEALKLLPRRGPIKIALLIRDAAKGSKILPSDVDSIALDPSCRQYLDFILPRERI